jgi:hypothetical protein
MDEFADMAKARASYKAFADALSAGRVIFERAGVPDPPPIPAFDAVLRRLTPEMKHDLFLQLRNLETIGPAEAIRIWQPLIRQAFGGRPGSHPNRVNPRKLQ